eukprot:gb/GECH01009875.1/.p1 GENE.gb/GECH01009875.1/~~gb/GECH01009875.1/.p1  ORF type:complete len:754 (+),score=178.78 gb/GECH01009875.1/:1-2262(+)
MSSSPQQYKNIPNAFDNISESNTSKTESSSDSEFSQEEIVETHTSFQPEYSNNNEVPHNVDQNSKEPKTPKNTNKPNTMKRRRSELPTPGSSDTKPRKKLRVSSPTEWKVENVDSQNSSSNTYSKPTRPSQEAAVPKLASSHASSGVKYQEPPSFNDISAISCAETVQDSSTVMPSSFAPNMSTFKPQLTTPASPRFRTNVRLSNKRKMSSHLEPELSKVKKKRPAKKRRNSSHLKKVLSGSKLPSRSTRPLTTPLEFRFRTDTRSKSRSCFTKSMLESKDHECSHGRKVNATFSGKITQPKPFKFHVKPRSQPQQKVDHSPYVPLREELDKYWKAVPDRFRTKPTQKPNPFEPRLTQPEEFSFQTNTRQRSRSTLTVDEKPEEKKAKPFKARALDSRIFETAGELGVPRVRKKSLTRSEPFNFRTTSRFSKMKEPSQHEDQENKSHQFKARPLSSRVLNGVSSMPKVESRPLTVPASPSFSYRGRSQLISSSDKENENHNQHSHYQFKARPMPDYNKSMGNQKPIEKRPPTRPEPFCLKTNVRGTTKEEALRRRLEEERENLRKLRQFKAQPILEANDMTNSKVSIERRDPTKPEPFSLRTDQRHDIHQKQLNQKLQEIEEMERELRQFKAQPIMESKEAYQVQPSKKPLTEVNDFELNSSKRAEKRRDFDTRLKERAEQMKKQEQEQEQERQMQELEELERFRQEISFKARPIPDFNQTTTTVKKSDKRLTVPHTPKFRGHKRSKKMIRML